MLSIQEFLKKINTGSAVRENIPMGLGMGFPVLNISRWGRSATRQSDI